MDKNQILEQLKQINYPGFNRDVVSFGMVKEVIIDNNIVTIILAISSSNEEKKNQLVQEISDKIKTDNYELKIKVLDQPTRETVDTSNKDANVEGNIKNRDLEFITSEAKFHFIFRPPNSMPSNKNWFFSINCKIKYFI